MSRHSPVSIQWVTEQTRFTKSVSLYLSPSPSLYQVFHFCLSQPPLVFNTCSHGCPLHPHRGYPSPTDPHTGISRESHPSSTVCPHTPAPPFPHTKSLPFHKSQLLSTAHNPMISVTISTGPFRSRKTVFQQCCQLRIRFSSYSFFITTTTVETPPLHKVDRTDVFD